MTHRLRSSLDLMRPALAPELFAPDVVDRLLALADELPAVHRAGFECRLDDDPRVDLQQGIVPGTWEPRAIAAFAAEREQHATGTTQHAWATARRFCEAWRDEDRSLAGSVGELWLEFDVEANADGNALGMLAPSLFATLPSHTARDAGGATAAGRVSEWLLSAEDAAAVRPLIEAWGSAAAARGGRVSHVGIMLGRQPAGVRLHVGDLPLRQLAWFLKTIEWPGDIAGAHAAATLLLDFVDTVVVCLDVALLPNGVRVLPRIGLEAFFTQKSGIDPRWVPFLAHLAARGLATRAKVEALLGWCGGSTPLTASGTWPDDLVVRSLTRPASWFGEFERRLSHVKITCDAGRAHVAKAYFGYGHLWFDTAPQRDRSPSAAGAPAIAPFSHRTLDEAIAAAEDFLLSARNQGGWWRDFYDLARSSRAGERVTGYASDEWVTAFVGVMLGTSDRPAARAAACHAWTLLARRRDASSGWGYHAQLPPDADSTAWTLRLADAIGAGDSSRTLGGRHFLAEQTRADGGVTCYRVEDCPDIAEFLQMAGPYDGWCASHTCVTASVAALGLDDSHVRHLLTAQQSDGRWTGHWWDDDEYATAIATTVLAVRGDEESTNAARHGAQWAASRVGATGAVHSGAHDGDSAFATALAVSAIAAVGDAGADGAALDRATAWLLAAQRSDGSFAPSARLRVPAPSAVDPLASPETTLTYLDRDAVFTTATVFAALVAVQRAGQGTH